MNNDLPPPPTNKAALEPVRIERFTRRNLPHVQIAGASYHISFRTKNLILPPDARAEVLQACRFWDGRRLHLHAAVVMPDHVHLLLTPRTDHHETVPVAVSLSRLLQSIKGYSAKQVNRIMGRAGTVWLDESYDRYIRSESDFEEKCLYIAGNPVAEGLAASPREYPYLFLEHDLWSGVAKAGPPQEHRREAGDTHRRDAGATRRHANVTQPGILTDAAGHRSVSLVSVSKDDRNPVSDSVAVEEPLAIRVSHGPLAARQRSAISITMRTPGQDADLAAGYLFAEGVVTQAAQILAIESSLIENAVRVELHPDVLLDLHHLDRHGVTTSSCGVCGKTSLDAIEAVCDGPRPGGTVAAATVHELPGRLREFQPAFASTGGLHAAALFDLGGTLLSVREDVGRHNAVDKLIGAEFRAGRTPLQDRILMVSGRASFELIQKAAVAGVPVFAAIGAPSSLAVSLAGRLGITLLGFVRDRRFNIYSGPERIA